MRRVRTAALLAAGAALVAAAGVAPAAAAPACEAPGFTPRSRVESAGVVVVYRTAPAAIEVGRHFQVEALVCAAGGAATLTGVDADMPAHRHGMNYRATVATKAPGRYVAEGLLFHMPGRWRLLFDVEHAGRRARLASDVVVD
ncbi:MAG: hypothetical protein FJ027_17245 [Candidatus Rokubacteria bacterium]|nr:hypothetical protein [Candidatus Rokubacteria bacterium]